jgi:hypothetical protein
VNYGGRDQNYFLKAPPQYFSRGISRTEFSQDGGPLRRNSNSGFPEHGLARSAAPKVSVNSLH